MLEFIKDIITSNTFLTVISGVLVFIAGQLFNEYFLKPIQDYKKLRAKIAYALTLYAYLYMNPIKFREKIDEIEEASYELRKLAAEVDATIELKPFANIFIPKIKILTKVSKNLIGLSNGFYTTNIEHTLQTNEVNRKEIYVFLKMKSYKEKTKKYKEARE